MTTKILLAAGLLSLLTACATAPKEQEIVQNLPVRQAPAPEIIAAPQPVAPVQRAPIAAPAPYMGPPAGTAEHFKYVSGEDRVYFGYNQYDLTPQSREVLRKQAGWLGDYGSAIIVIGGNADERGTREYNLALGARRANAVKEFLVSQGVAPSRLTTVSYGKERPIDGRSNEAAWSLNRNAHSAVLVGGSS